MMALVGGLISTAAGAVWAWARYRSDVVEFDDREIWFSRGGHRVWGGPWSKMQGVRRGIRSYIVDEQGRTLHRSDLLGSFLRSDDLVLKIREIPYGEPVRPTVRALIISVLIFLVGGVLVAFSLPRLQDLMARTEMTIDRSTAPIIVGTCLGVVMLLVGMVSTSLVGLGFFVKDQESKPAPWRPGAPVEMEVGRRYRYRNAEKLRKDMLPGWGVLVFFAPLFAILAWALEDYWDPSQIPMALILLLCLASLVGLAVFSYRHANNYRQSLLDEFSLTRNGELVVYRGSEVRTLVRRPSKPRSFTHDPRFLAWSECYRDHRGSYYLDRRYLEEA